MIDYTQELNHHRHEKDKISADTAVCLVHELGHTIPERHIPQEDIPMAIFTEVLPITLEFIFAKTRTNDEEEYLKQRYERIMSLRRFCKKTNNKDYMEAGYGYRYAIGRYLGLYLSQLYFKDKKKYNTLYSKLKEYTYKEDSIKLFDLFSQEKEIQTGEFLEEEFNDIEPIIKKFDKI